MGDVVVGADAFASEMELILQASMREVDKDAKAAVKAAGKASVGSLRKSGAWADKSGKYRKGWRSKEEGDILHGYEATVYQAAQPGLTHLLEFGHGGPQPAPPHPHIEQAYAQGAVELEGRLTHG